MFLDNVYVNFIYLIIFYYYCFNDNNWINKEVLGVENYKK